MNHLKNCIEDNENHIESICTKLEQKEKQVKEFSVELDAIKKAKSMIELILSKTNTEIETLHEENSKYVKQLLTIIEEYKKSEELSRNNISNLENNMKQMQDDLALKDNIIISNEQKITKNDQYISDQEEKIRKIYNDNAMLESSVKDMKSEIETQHNDFSDKLKDMENCLGYYFDQLKNARNSELQIKAHLNCKKNEIDKQTELINFQKNLIETLQSKICSQEINLKENIQESSLNLCTLQEQLKTVSNEKTMLENNLKINEVQMKKSSEEFQCEIYNMKNILESRSNEINQYRTYLEELKDSFDKKQNDFNDQLIISNKQIEIISNLRLEKYQIEEKLKSSGEYLLQKENEVKSFEEMFLQRELEIKNLKEENHILTNNIDMITLTLQNKQCDYDKHLEHTQSYLQLYNDRILIQTQKLFKLKDLLQIWRNELEAQMNLKFQQNEYILNLETNNNDLLEKLNIFDQCLWNKNVEIINLEKELKDHSSTIEGLEERLGVVNIEKIMIETNLNETTEQLKNAQEQFTENNNNILNQLSNCEENIIQLKNQCKSMENMLENKQKELEEHLKSTLEQNNTFKIIMSEKELLENKLSNATAHAITTQAEIKSLNDQLDEHKSFILELKIKLNATTMEKNSIDTRLKDTMNQQEIINLEFSEQIKQLNDLLNDYINKNNDLQNDLIDLTNDLNKKQLQFEQTNDENNRLKETVNTTQNRCIYLEDILKDLGDNILKHNVNYITISDDIKKQFMDLKQIVNEKDVELEKQIELCNAQKETIIKINCKNESFSDKIQNLEDVLSHKEYEFNLCEGKLYDCSNTINHLEKELNEIKNEKSSLELKLNETTSQITYLSQDFTLKLEIKDKEILKIQEKLSCLQNELEKQIEQSNEHLETISFLNIEKDIIMKDINKLQECLNEKEHSSETLQENILEHVIQYKELQSQMRNLESQFNENKIQLENECKKSKQKLEDMENQYDEIQKQFKIKQIELDEHIEKYNCQIEKIEVLTSDRDNLIHETNILNNILLNKDCLIASYQEKMVKYEDKNDEIKIKNDALEIELKQANKQLEITHNDLTQKLKETEEQITNLQKELSCERIHLKTQIKETEEQVEIREQQNKISTEQKETINTLTYENKILTEEINTLKESLVQNKCVLASNQDKLHNHKEIECQNTSLKLELNKLKNLHQESTNQISEMNTKLLEAQEQLSQKQFEIEQQINLKNITLTDIYQKINVLKNMKNELELEFKNEITVFETCLKSYSNCSLNYINNKYIQDHNQDSLMEVITSADTFIEQNGIHLAQVVNLNEYPIIERLKQLFEALKMFIININTQGCVQAINLTDNEYTASKDTYSELLTKYNMYVFNIVLFD